MPDLSSFWALDPKIAFLNHGSFGACPLPVLEEQSRLRRLMESEPVRFLDRELESRMDEARAALARFAGADPEDLAVVPNATAGVNTVLRSLRFEPGDEILATDMEYNACRNAADFAVGGTRVRSARLPFPAASPEAAAQAVLACVTKRTRLALLSHITSPTGIILPVESLVRELQGRGIDVLVDGAHAPGQVPLDLKRLDAAYYTGNCHKWLCAPKGAAFLHVRRDRQDRIRPLVISHGANSRRTDRSRFRLEADWTGTDDPTPFLCVPAAIRFMESAVPDGWPEVMRRNHVLAVEACRILAEALGVGQGCSEAMLGSMAALPLPPELAGPPAPARGLDPLQERLFSEHRIEVPVFPWPTPDRKLLRVSAQLYNRREQYLDLASALRAEARK
ncbi:MAG: aminotransferase class V-fold PLP-dependent enzyme [Elusimicrobia bacterium]|nr:aminotransferase class V-fold PLP-dependent enzyme [Elusimicrobiota bacterium]